MVKRKKWSYYLPFIKRDKGLETHQYHHKIKLFLDFAPEHEENNVPDPYFGGQNGFEHVFDLVEDASQGFYQTIIS